MQKPLMHHTRTKTNSFQVGKRFFDLRRHSCAEAQCSGEFSRNESFYNVQGSLHRYFSPSFRSGEFPIHSWPKRGSTSCWCVHCLYASASTVFYALWKLILKFLQRPVVHEHRVLWTYRHTSASAICNRKLFASSHPFRLFAYLNRVNILVVGVGVDRDC